MRKITSTLSIIILIIIGCSSTKQTQMEVRQLDEMVVTASKEEPDYRASETRKHDLIHTRLDVRFDWQKQHLIGEAILQLTPYFYPTNQLELDAKGFDLHQIELVQKTENRPLKYEYDGEIISIELNKKYARTDTFTIKIDYTAKPNDLDIAGSAAITGAKGLYFINPLEESKSKPRQLWTQGETEASSCWFPTIDSPNERTSQEMYITVEEKLVTLSNGKKVSSNLNGDGTRTDYWKQELPHAPYLFMMAVGEFAVIEEKWNDLVVDYYVEPEYSEYASGIFGNTPEMLTFYSEILGYPYPWDKYSQVVVSDFVSGAMENTSASVFFDGLHQTDKERLDGDHEDIIAHELIHHWFGDLVTCESWSNIPLNEAFATYGEYLWIEYKYGRHEADLHGHNDLRSYFREAQGKQVPLIRYHYKHRDDMFDAHSYEKGGRVLHLLRNYVGDEAFFEGLNLYLRNNAYQAVETDHLRLAFEEVTGEDLNWFFDQWFFTEGHPDVNISYHYDDELKKQTITIDQKQEKTFRFPLDIDFYSKDAVVRKRVWVDEKIETLVFDGFDERPLLVNVDATKSMIWEKNDQQTVEQWAYQYKNAPLYLDQAEAVSALSSKENETAKEILADALKHSFWGIRRLAVNSLYLQEHHSSFIPAVKDIIQHDPKSKVRSSGIIQLRSLGDKQYEPLFTRALHDPSYLVNASALKGVSLTNKELALSHADEWDEIDNAYLKQAIAYVFAHHGNEDNLPFFEGLVKVQSERFLFDILPYHGQLLNRADPSKTEKSYQSLANLAQNSETWWLRYRAIEMLGELKTSWSERGYNTASDTITELFTRLKAKEDNQNVKFLLQSL